MSWWKRIFGAAASHCSASQNSQPIEPTWQLSDYPDPIYHEAAQFVVDSRRASVSAIQRKFQLGYNRAAHLIEAMEQDGLITAMNSNGSREVIATLLDAQSVARVQQAALDAAENERAMRLSYLLDKYEDEATVRRIIERTIWEGMSSAQLFDTLGEPEAIDQKYLKQVARELWKYHPEGKNRYATRITLENGHVVGWDFKAN